MKKKINILENLSNLCKITVRKNIDRSVLQLESEAEKQIAIQELLDDSSLLSKLQDKWGIEKEIITNLFTKSLGDDFDLEDELNETIFPIVQSQITQHMSELFYYPSLQTTHHYTIGGVEGDWAVSKEEWCDIMKINPETEERIRDKTPKYNRGTLPRSNNLDEMVKTVGQAQVAFAHMLPELALFGDAKYKEIMNHFLANSVINASRENAERSWGDMIQELDRDGTLLEKLLDKIAGVFKIDYQNPRESRLKSSIPTVTLATEHEIAGGR